MCVQYRIGNRWASPAPIQSSPRRITAHIMCGIFALVLAAAGDNDDAHDNAGGTPSWLQRRGPDVMATVQTGDHNNSLVLLRASVLHMRDRLVPQPVRVVEGIYFCWNGEVYDDHVWEPAVMDTEYIVEQLRRVLMVPSEEEETTESIADKLHQVLSSLSNAEFACCLVTPNAVLYARDPWGRRSLLVAQDVWCVSSVADPTTQHWEEVPPGVVHVYNVKNPEQSMSIPFEKPPTLLHEPASACNCMLDASRRLDTMLEEAVRRRCLPDNNTAVLFSGGLDSSVVAALALRILPSITLVTVSFVDGPGQQGGAAAADAVAAEVSFRELQALFPSKSIDFVHRVIDWAQVQEQEQRIRQLIHPKTTLMDLNIAVALWFAAGAATDARALLSGLGADELLGGYQRHRRAWQTGGDAALAAELELDQERLWDRNLGRDDRVLSDTSHEVRFPFLDPHVVEFVRQQPLRNVVDFTVDKGGDKRILRLVAERMGLQAASQQPKRAIQFGSRVAHVSDTRRFGSRRKASGTAVAQKAPS